MYKRDLNDLCLFASPNYLKKGNDIYGRIKMESAYKGLGNDSVAQTEQTADAKGLVSVLSGFGKGSGPLYGVQIR